MYLFFGFGLIWNVLRYGEEQRNILLMKSLFCMNALTQICVLLLPSCHLKSAFVLFGGGFGFSYSVFTLEALNLFSKAGKPQCFMKLHSPTTVKTLINKLKHKRTKTRNKKKCDKTDELKSRHLNTLRVINIDEDSCG